MCPQGCASSVPGADVFVQNAVDDLSIIFLFPFCLFGGLLFAISEVYYVQGLWEFMALSTNGVYHLYPKIALAGSQNDASKHSILEGHPVFAEQSHSSYRGLLPG